MPISTAATKSSRPPRGSKRKKRPTHQVGVINGIAVLMRQDRNGGAIAPELDLGLIREFCELANHHGDPIVNDHVSIQMPNHQGLSKCVPVTARDKTFSAQKLGGRRRYLFVLNREGVPTNWVTLKFVYREQGPDSYFEIVAGYFGEKAPPLPSQPNGDNPVSKEFWSRHALLYERGTIREHTRKYSCTLK